jgi:MFS family permease
MPGIAGVLALSIIGFGTLVVPLDSAVNLAFPEIVAGFGLPMAAIQWVVICYMLPHASLMLVFGRLGDMLGYRAMFLAGSAVSTIAFILCAAAPSYAWLLAARALQGAGAALLLSCGPALATAQYAEALRPRVLGLYTMMFGLGGALGPVLAGALVAEWGWRAVFAFRVPVAALAFALAWRLPASRSTAAARFDAQGALLLTAAITAFLLALDQLQHAEKAIWPLAAFTILSAATLWLFIRRTARIAHPLIELGYFRQPGFGLINAGHLLINLAGFAVLLLAPFLLARLAGLSTIATGAILSASPAGIMLAAPLAGRLAARMSRTNLAFAGATLVALGLAAIALIGGTFNLPLLAAAMFVQGTGHGLFQLAYFDIVTGTIARRDRGVAGSLAMLTRTLGIVGGASALMLCLRGLTQAAISAGMPDDMAFLAAFSRTMLVAAGIAAAVALLLLLRRRPATI